MQEASNKPTPRQHPIKPVIVAFACEPGRGSEPGTGWHFIEEMSREMPVYVLCHTLHKEPMEQYLATQHKYHPIHVKYVRPPKWIAWIWGPEYCINVYYYLWHYFAIRVLRQWHAEQHFDIVHHLTYTRCWFPTVASVLDIPFIWGPVGGGTPVPWKFQSVLGYKARLIEIARTALRTIWSFDPFLRRTVRRASLALATSHDCAPFMKKLGAKHVDVLSATALPTGQFEEFREIKNPDGRFRFVYVGRVVHWKGLHLALHAFAQLDLPEARFRIVGDGPYQAEILKLIDQLNLRDRVELPGYPSHRECVQLLAEGDVLVHVALRDSAGVVAEGLRLHKPIICLNLGTPSVMVDHTSGVMIDPIEPQQTIDALKQAMHRIATDASFYQSLKQGTVQRDIDMSREARGRRVLSMYRSLVVPRHERDLPRAVMQTMSR